MQLFFLAYFSNYVLGSKKKKEIDYFFEIVCDRIFNNSEELLH